MKRSLSSDILVAKETLRQQIQAEAQRLWRFNNRSTFVLQNKTFKEDVKRLYHELGRKKIEANELSTLQGTEEVYLDQTRRRPEEEEARSKSN